MLKKLGIMVAAGAALASTVFVGPSTARAADAAHTYATYHGRVIDLAVSWEGAQACSITDLGNTCYDSEREMNANLLGDVLGLVSAVALSSCSSSLRLYDNTGFVGPMVSISTRGTFIALSSFGFSAKTSSYIVGACGAALYDGGTLYPGNTSAGAAAASMLSGWNNRVTTAFLN
ncbi:MAG TPA: hypothetical protein VL738_16795 [Dactylosporangium sp.]|nr:hypothetical protein [Dactylosporangium sp.]